MNRSSAPAAGAVVSLGLLASLVLGACGGGGAAATAGAPGVGGGTGGPGAAAGTDAPAPAGPTAAPGGVGAGTDLPYPCSLLTPEEISALTGYNVVRSSSTTVNLGDNDLSCSWDLDGPADLPGAVVVGFQLTGGRDAFRARQDFLDDAPAVEGVGDAAIQEETLVVSAVKGDTYLTLTYMEFPEPEGMAAKLAKAIADDL
ncbi:MAG TPA: DUF3558 family protein [Candidatus Limnocylindrales bacterium]|nr:DUF3558 family protein [Candidatus Limnocylindrales bacterium]